MEWHGTLLATALWAVLIHTAPGWLALRVGRGVVSRCGVGGSYVYSAWVQTFRGLLDEDASRGVDGLLRGVVETNIRAFP